MPHASTHVAAGPAQMGVNLYFLTMLEVGAARHLAWAPFSDFAVEHFFLAQASATTPSPSDLENRILLGVLSGPTTRSFKTDERRSISPVNRTHVVRVDQKTTGTTLVADDSTVACSVVIMTCKVRPSL